MVERLYPGVYIAEIPLAPRPVDAVATSTNEFSTFTLHDRSALGPNVSARQWTDHNPHDPGVTLLQLLAWSLDALTYRAGPGTRHAIERERPTTGVVAGVQVDGPDGSAQVKVSSGTGIDPGGASIDCDAAALYGDPKP